MKTIKLFFLVAILINFGCKKNSDGNTSEGCNISGFGTTHFYRFWTSSSSIAPFNVKIFDDSDKEVYSNAKQTKIYYQVDGTIGLEPTPSKYDASKEAVFELRQGKQFKYTVSNGSQTWNGTINVPCKEGELYNNIRIQ